MADISKLIQTPNHVLQIIGDNLSIDPNKYPLKRIVRHYHVNPEIQCSLSMCHRWHNEGYIVELDDGRLTNVGHICGKQFGEKFAIEEQKYQEQILRPQLIEAISSSKKKLAELKPLIDKLEQRAQIVSKRKSAFVSLFKEATQALKRRAVNGDTEVFESVERNKQEVDDLLAANPFQSREALQVKNISKGHIKGLRLFSENVFETTTSNLCNPLEQLVNLVDYQTLPLRKLVEWESWLRSLDEKSSHATALVEDSEQFFTKDNFKLISLLPNSPEVKSRLSKLDIPILDSVNLANKTDSQKALQSIKKFNRKERRKLQFGTNFQR